VNEIAPLTLMTFLDLILVVGEQKIRNDYDETACVAYPLSAVAPSNLI